VSKPDAIRRVRACVPSAYAYPSCRVGQTLANVLVSEDEAERASARAVASRTLSGRNAFGAGGSSWRLARLGCITAALCWGRG
jgi:hypothetical protein